MRPFRNRLLARRIWVNLLRLAVLLVLLALLLSIVANHGKSAFSSVAPAAIIVGFTAWQRIRREGFWRTVWRLRRASTTQRAELLDAVPPGRNRRRLEKILMLDGSQEQEGDIERFPFPARLARQATRSYWLTWGVAGSLFAVVIAVPQPTYSRIYFAAAGSLAAVIAWRAWRREATYRSVIEVTPFRITEILPNGIRRTALWNQSLILRNEPRQLRMRLTLPTGADAIILDYRRMGFQQLRERVMEYGAFKPMGPEAGKRTA